MKVSISKFYQEVTGAKTANRKITEAALKRWQVPYTTAAGKGDNVDIIHLANAKTMYEQEQAALDLRRGRSNGGDTDALDRNTAALRAAETAILLLVEHIGALGERA